ncbi:7-carboxy-7-deazaguanine synthase [Usitatibacter rugosus]|uniref:7-carboxy-7-deazaguanine synthase n=1 Tax=Usitatibacter rugosus TaxID=2732067 RepID=A0A6M4GQW0_9PROT|nr:7-carboxy-7-deazaguanine synthase [Usitatibacter rugosus]QJR09445.1 7-carboxy-7-deazaguanine synthase [Usitatibacter rugosus]
MYSVKEIFYTLQGEGANTGTPAVFCRFAGCNLWSGREADRATAACDFCDTDFVGTDGPGGGKFASPDALADAVKDAWQSTGSDSFIARAIKESDPRFVVCTGGEPLLQLDAPLIAAFHARGFKIAVETNGTQPVPPGIDWVCVSPKATAPVVVERGDELKLVFPQREAMPERFESLDFEHFFLQPMDGPTREANTRAAVEYCLHHPRWRLSLQTHKIIGIA